MDVLPPDSHETLRLLDRHAGGDRNALGALFDRHRHEIEQVVRKRLSHRLKPRIDSSDVVQDTLVDVHRRLDDYLRRRPMPFRLWLVKATHQRLRKIEERHLAAAKRTVDREIPLPERSSLLLARRMASSVATASKSLEARETAAQVRRLLATLGPADREVLMLRVFDGLSNAETACVLEIEPETAKKRYTRALMRLQQLARQHFRPEDTP